MRTVRLGLLTSLANYTHTMLKEVLPNASGFFGNLLYNYVHTYLVDNIQGLLYISTGFMKHCFVGITQTV